MPVFFLRGFSAFTTPQRRVSRLPALTHRTEQISALGNDIKQLTQGVVDTRNAYVLRKMMRKNFTLFKTCCKNIIYACGDMPKAVFTTVDSLDEQYIYKCMSRNMETFSIDIEEVQEDINM